MNLASEITDDTLPPTEQIYKKLVNIRNKLEKDFEKFIWFILASVRMYENDGIILVIVSKEYKEDIKLPVIFNGIKLYYKFGEISPF